MPTSPTNANIMNAIRNDLGAELQDRLPVATADNLAAVYDKMMKYQCTRDQVVPSMIERIGMHTIESLMWRNPIGRYAKTPMRYGMTDEETYINMCRGAEYSPDDNYEIAFATYQSYIMTMFHRVNFNMRYPVTVSYDNMRYALLSEYGIRDLITSKMTSAIAGEQWDEYIAEKGLIDDGYTKKLLPAVKVTQVTNEESGKELLTAVKEAVNDFKFPKPTNNIAGATSHSEPYQLVWITTPKVDAVTSVQDLAYAFHQDKAAVEVQTIIVDGFKNTAIQGVLLDVRFFNVRDHFRELVDQKIAANLSWNYLYIVSMMISPSPFYPIRVFTTEDVGKPTGGTITEANYTAGAETPLTITPTGGTGYVPKLWDWTIVSGNTGKTAFVPGTNILIADAAQTGTVKVRATYRLDTTVKVEKDLTAHA